MKFRRKPRLTVQSATIITAVLAGIGLLLFRLVSLVPNIGRVEHWLPTFRDSLSVIWNTPLELPIVLSSAIVAAVSPVTGVGWSRLPSVLLGFGLLMVAYWLFKRWYGYRMALFGTILLASSAWFLHASRLAAHDIVYPLSMMVLLALAALWHQPTWSKKLRYISAIAVALFLYVPGFIWLLIGVIAFEWRTIARNVKQGKLQSGLALSLGIILLAPLIHFLALDPSGYKPLLGLPAQLPNIVDFGKEFLLVWQHIFIGGYSDPTRNLAGLALIDIFTTVAFIVGIYLYSKHLKAIRTRQLIWLWVVGTILIALQGMVVISLLLPIVTVLAVGGIGYLLHMWLTVFPRNPYARIFGVGLMGLVLLFAVGYNLRNYYVAWPNNAETRAVFTAKQ